MTATAEKMFMKSGSGWSSRALRLTAVTVISLLFLINLIGWGVYFYARSFLNDEMGERLTAIARTSRLTLPNIVLLSYVEGVLPHYLSVSHDEGSPNYARVSREGAALLEILGEIRDRNKLEEVFLIDRDRNLLLSTNDKAVLGQEVRVLMVDRSEIEEALSGTAVSSTLYSVGGRYFRRGYAPIYLRGNAIGVIGVSAPAEFFEELHDFRNILYIILGLSILMAITVSVLQYRMAQTMIRTSQELERSSRLAELGHLAACVAHEIRNPLSIISGTVEILERRGAACDPDTIELYEYLKGEVERLNHVVTNFLDFGRPSAMNMENADVNALVERACEGLERELAEDGISLRIDLGANVGEISMDSERIHQALLNIILNARDAMKGASRKGLIMVRTERRGRIIAISITDEGTGMTPEMISKIFDPFFSTKSAGSGLGLSIVKSLVEAHGGEIKVESRPGVGSTFTILLNKA